MSVEYALFDLGGVLFHMRGYEPIVRMLGQPLTREELHVRWVASKAVRAFETGECELGAFSVRLVEEFELSLDPSDFAAQFCSFQGEEMEGGSELVSEISRSIGVGCLSNTNPPHVQAMTRGSCLLELLDHRFYSYEIGVMKPEPGSFDHVIEALGLAPNRILFFDDSRLNVEAAKARGMQALEVHGPGQARMAIEAALTR